MCIQGAYAMSRHPTFCDSRRVGTSELPLGVRMHYCWFSHCRLAATVAAQYLPASVGLPHGVVFERCMHHKYIHG